MADQEKILKLILKYVSDEASIKNVTSEIKAIESAEEQAKKKADEFRQSLEKIKQTGEKLTFISTNLTAIGAAMSGPFIAAANSYVQKAGQSEEISRKWLASTEKMEAAQMRIGKVAAEAILPTLEKVASIAEAAAGFAEKHPGVVEAAVTIGTAMATVGAIGIAVGQGIKLVADIKILAATAQQLLAGQLMNAAADKQLVASKGMGLGGGGKGGGLLGGGAGVALAAVAGAAAGTYAVDQLARDEAKNAALKRASGGALEAQTFGKYASVYAGGLGGAVGLATGQGMDASKKQAAEWFKTVAQWTGEIAEDAPKAATGLKQTNSAINAVAANAENYSRSGESAIGSSARRQVSFLAETINTSDSVTYGSRASALAARRARMGTTTAVVPSSDESMEMKARQDDEKAKAEEQKRAYIEELKAQQEYLKQRKEMITKSNEDSRRAEQEHNLTMYRMKQDATTQLNEAASQRDAISFLKEWRSSQLSQSRAEEDFQIQQTNRNKDLQMQIASLDEENKIRKNAYSQSLKDVKNFAGSMTKIFADIASGLSGGSNSNRTLNYEPTYNVSGSDSNFITGQIAATIDNRLMRIVGV